MHLYKYVYIVHKSWRFLLVPAALADCIPFGKYVDGVDCFTMQTNFIFFYWLLLLLSLFLLAEAFSVNLKTIDCRVTGGRSCPLLVCPLADWGAQLAFAGFPFALLSANKAPDVPQLRLQLISHNHCLCNSVRVCVCCACTLPFRLGAAAVLT